jgi:pyruvate dehydrogenase E2 component (dihydrolipoamide acetyltransferase)
MAEAITLGRMTDTMEEGFVAELSLKVGDTVKVGDSIAEIETDKATLPLESYYAGKILYVAAKKGDSLKIGDLIAIVGKEGEAYEHLLVAKEIKSEDKNQKTENIKNTKQSVAPIAEEKTIIHSTQADARLKASPLAKSIAREKGIDLKKVSGSGEDGRIVKRDLENVSTSQNSKVAFVGKEGFTDLRVSQMRKTIAKRLLQSKNENPHFYLTVDINMDKAVELRTALNNVLPTKVSFNDIVIRAVAMALRQNIAANTSWLGDTIRQYEHIHIGMAVAVEDGLVVPVIRFADGKTIAEISEEAKSLAQKATSKKLLPPEMEGSTFTISNLGMFGIENFTAIINEPNACILAVGAIRKAPAVVNDEIKVANLMKVTLSSDHRVVDGAVGAKLLQSLKTILEEPVRLLI